MCEKLLTEYLCGDLLTRGHSPFAVLTTNLALYPWANVWGNSINYVTSCITKLMTFIGSAYPLHRSPNVSNLFAFVTGNTIERLQIYTKRKTTCMCTCEDGFKTCDTNVSRKCIQCWSVRRPTSTPCYNLLFQGTLK